MRDEQFLDLLREAMWTAVVVSTPMLTAALVIGLAIGLIQALTSVQEMTLTFVPKVAAMGVVFWVSISFMGQSIITLFHQRILPLIAGA